MEIYQLIFIINVETCKATDHKENLWLKKKSEQLCQRLYKIGWEICFFMFGMKKGYRVLWGFFVVELLPQEIIYLGKTVIS